MDHGRTKDHRTDQVRSTKYQGLQYATFMSNARAMLKAIARRAMVELGFEPDFPAAVVAQVAHLTEAAATHPERRDLRHLLWCSIDNDDSRDLDLSVVKLLGRGECVVEPPNEPTPDHFGLAVDDYTHATAPNRRFADLVTQRLVKAALSKQRPPYSDAALGAIATRCMEREDAANRVERQVKKAAAAMVLQHRVGEVFEAVVTGASPKGTWVRLERPTSGYHTQRRPD